MLETYRSWLESELQLLGNASHHAYAFGQANMAKRALERFDETFAAKTVLVLDGPERAALCAALAAHAWDAEGAPEALRAIAKRLEASPAVPPSVPDIP